jgi:hypothetical protein
MTVLTSALAAGVPGRPDVLQDRPARCPRSPARADHRDREFRRRKEPETANVITETDH